MMTEKSLAARSARLVSLGYPPDEADDIAVAIGDCPTIDPDTNTLVVTIGGRTLSVPMSVLGPPTE